MAKTPKYIFEKEKIESAFSTLKNFLQESDIYYALKCNSEIGVLKKLHQLGSKFEVASTEEFKKLLRIGVSTEDIICGLPVKSIEMINYLYDKGCRYFVFDHIQEFKKLLQYTQYSKKILRIYVNDIAPNSIEYGMRLDQLNSIIAESPELINYIDGISFHLTENVNITPLIEVLERVEHFLSKLSGGEKILNIGGGYRNEAMDEFFEVLNSRLRILKSRYQLKIFAEPGRAIVQKAGKLVARVILVKEEADIVDVYIDAGIPSGFVRRPGFVKVIGASEIQNKKIYRFFDTTCLHKPLLVYPLKYDLKENNIIEFGHMGAYTTCYSTSFHAWKKPFIEML